MVMTDLEKAIEAYEETQKGPRSYLQETIDAADELAKAARAYIAAQDDDAASLWTRVEDGLPELGRWVLVTVEGLLRPVLAVFCGDADWYISENIKLQNAVLAWMPAPEPYQLPKPVDPLTVAVEALEKIASRHVTKDPLWWQRAAREALEQVEGEE